MLDYTQKHRKIAWLNIIYVKHTYKQTHINTQNTLKQNMQVIIFKVYSVSENLEECASA